MSEKLIFVFWSILTIFLNSQTLIAQQSFPKSYLFKNPIESSIAPNGCNITVNAGPDITICTGIGKQINGMVTGGYNTIIWDPIDGLSNPNIANPIANPIITTKYTLIARGVSANLFLNGGFENGSIAPSTSSYTQYTNLNSFAGSTGGYMVLSVPQIAAQFGCNPPIGLFTMAVTPVGPSVNFLCQTIAVSPNTVYKVKFKCFGIPYIFGSPPAVGCKINGTLIGTLDVDSGLCTESDADYMWNSGAAVSANICFANYGGTGFFSMFSIDDIEFRECCEVKDDVIVTVYDLIADIAKPDEISCYNAPMILDGSGSSSGPNITYLWTTVDGKIEGNDKSSTIKVSTPGTYKLKVIGEFGCDKEVSVKVTGNVTPPDVTASNTDINCTNPTGSIDAKSKNTMVTYDWSGPNGYGSTKATNFNLKDPGDYVLTVTDDYGCKTTKKVTVKDNRTEVFLELKGDTIQCGEDSIQLIASSVSPKPSFIWKYNNIVIATIPKIFAKDTGWYYITVKDSLGCSTSDSFKVLSFQTQVPTQINVGSINCRNSSVQLLLKTDTSGTINWKGPNGYNSNLKQPFVKDTGWYYLSITTKGGCKGSDSIHVNSDNMNPDVFVSASDTITCNKQFINISGGSMTPNSIITWMGPSGILGNNLNYMVSDSGDYTIIVEGSNGCLNSAMIKVYKILDTPTLILKNDTLDCIKKSTQLNVSIDTSVKYTWTGPNGFNSNLRNPITSVEGEYQISVISKNGCPNFGIINIVKDTIAPQFTLTTDTLNCIKTFISPNLNGDPNITTYQWTGPNNFNSTVKNPQINSPGNYNLIVTNSNGCFSNQNFTIIQDTIKPIVIISADEIVCNKQAFIRVNSITANVPFEWTGPNNFRANTLNAQVTKAGWYIINVIGNNGCLRTDSIEVIQKDQLPDLITHDDTLTCSKNSLDLFADSQTPGVKYEWTGPNNFTSTLKNPKTTVGGIYTIKVIDANGCEVSKQINISQLNTTSIIQLTNIDSLDCKKNMTSLVVNSIQNATQINWTGPNNFTSTNKNITVNSGGWYIVKFINEFGCITLDSILIVDYRMLPQVTVSDDSINCIRRSITLSLNTSELNLKYNWSGPNGFISKLKNPLITTGGTFNVTVTNGFNCELVQVINIKLDTTGPDLNLSADTLTCLRPNVPIKAGTSIQGFNILWTGPNGFTSMFPQAIVGTAGTYICTLTNPRTKCTTTKTIEVLEDTNRIRSSVFDKEDASCGLNNGSINIININGGTPTYLYSIDNGLTYLSQSLFDSLSIGTYNIQIKDRNGCVFGGKVSINSTPGVDIDLTPSIDVNINDLITLNLTIKNSNNSTIFWDPSDQLSCNNCANPILTATKDQTINVIVTDENGCSDQASIIVRVRSDVKIYVPNSISPNGDQLNEYFYPTSNVDFLINNMSIFSRWGERIFSRDKFMSNSEKDGWNGTYSGQKVNPGVYIYSITYSDGKDIQTLYGDITVLH